MTTVVGILIGLLLGAAVGALAVALAAGARRRDDQAAVDQALVDLIDMAAQFTSADKRHAFRARAQLIVERIRPYGHHALPDPSPIPRSPDWVHRLLDAYATGDRLDLSGCWVPPDVQGRLRAILAAGGEATTPVPGMDTDPLTGRDVLTQAATDALRQQAEDTWLALRELGPVLAGGDAVDFRDRGSRKIPHVDDLNAELRERAAAAYGQVVHGGQ